MLIAITGYKGSGKDSVAEFMHEITHAHVMAFADPLKEVTFQLFGISKGAPKERVSRNSGMTTRESWQAVADMCKTRFGNDIFVRIMDRRVNVFQNNLFAVVIPDLRSPVEYEWVKKKGGYIVRVQRPGVKCDPADREEGYIDFITPHFEIKNGGTLGDLKMATRMLLSEMGYGK